MIKIASARISEKGTINGAKGDQTKKEVCVSDWKNYGQTNTIRFKDSKKSKLAVKIAKELVKNDNIGYGQSDRYTSYDYCKKYLWDIGKISKIGKCNTDCSMLIAIICNFVFGKTLFPKTFTTATMISFFKKYPKHFEVLPLQKNKKVGDIEMKRGHTTIIVEVSK